MRRNSDKTDQNKNKGVSLVFRQYLTKCFSQLEMTFAIFSDYNLIKSPLVFFTNTFRCVLSAPDQVNDFPHVEQMCLCFS